MNITGELTRENLDSEEIVDLDQAYFPHPWSTSQWKELNPAHHLLYSWKMEDKLIGYALFSHVPGDDTAHLYKILVLPDYRRTGKTVEFWSCITSELRKQSVTGVFLEVEASNLSAVRFYEKVGFLTLKKTKGYYSNGEDGLMMSLTL